MATILLSLFLGILASVVTIVLVLGLLENKYKELFSARTIIFASELANIGDSLLEALAERRKDVEEECYETLKENQDQIEALHRQAHNDDGIRLMNLEKQIQEKVAFMRKQLAELDKHFHESQEDDVTRHLLSCAYNMVASGTLPQNNEGSDLIHAVVAHQKAGIPVLVKVADEKKTSEDIKRKLN